MIADKKRGRGSEGRGRLLCVTSSFPRWKDDSTTPFVLHLAKDLQDIGWQVDVLAPHAPGAATKEIMAGVNVERFRYLWPSSQETVCYQGGALINLRKNKTNAIKLPMLVIAEWAGLFRRLAMRDYDVLHSHWVLPQGFTGVMSAAPLRIPHVVTAHGGDIFSLQGRINNGFKRFVLHHADAVTVNSTVTLNAVSQIAPGLKELYRIPMGVSSRTSGKNDTEVQHIRDQYTRGNGPLIAFAGRLIEEKGIEDLLLAINRMVPALPEVSAIIIGEGQDRHAFENMCTSLGLNDRVKFLGWIQPESVGRHLAAADVFVGPSRKTKDGWMEAQGLTFLEAMMARTPVVATRSGGLVDSVRHEDTGLLVNERAPDEIATAVKKLLNEPLLAGKLRENGYALAVNEFSREASAHAFSELFERMALKKVS